MKFSLIWLRNPVTTGFPTGLVDYSCPSAHRKCMEGGGGVFDVPSSFPEIAKASRKCKTFTITKIPRLMLF